ncbi:MAG: winged helix-turn-helix domain-containing protein [Planctomycetes bacterium]|nr:winged helix-turn-helix domain-containing protein [Planctomycetota bacterium]
MKKTGKSKKSACKKFEMDITDYVLGDRTFLTKSKEKKLLVHLGKCLRCQKDFWSWRKIWAVMVGKHQSERPAFKAKMAALMAQFKSNPMAAKKEIGSAAGQVYDILIARGEMPVYLIRKETGLRGYPFYEAVGHLVMGGKVTLNKSNGSYDSLRPQGVNEHLQTGI